MAKGIVVESEGLIASKLAPTVTLLTQEKRCTPWRGSLLPLGCEAALSVSASHSSGSKLPRHRFVDNLK
ncbi:hypothetical protein DZG01_07215 [Pseudomonas fluorescens]|nr:hypothetical protein DZG01_07215 [Pseudomonas fluorescens]